MNNGPNIVEPADTASGQDFQFDSKVFHRIPGNTSAVEIAPRQGVLDTQDAALRKQARSVYSMAAAGFLDHNMTNPNARHVLVTRGAVGDTHWPFIFSCEFDNDTGLFKAVLPLIGANTGEYRAFQVGVFDPREDIAGGILEIGLLEAGQDNPQPFQTWETCLYVGSVLDTPLLVERVLVPSIEGDLKWEEFTTPISNFLKEWERARMTSLRITPDGTLVPFIPTKFRRFGDNEGTRPATQKHLLEALLRVSPDARKSIYTWKAPVTSRRTLQQQPERRAAATGRAPRVQPLPEVRVPAQPQEVRKLAESVLNSRVNYVHIAVVSFIILALLFFLSSQTNIGKNDTDTPINQYPTGEALPGLDTIQVAPLSNTPPATGLDMLGSDDAGGGNPEISANTPPYHALLTPPGELENSNIWTYWVETGASAGGSLGEGQIRAALEPALAEGGLRITAVGGTWNLSGDGEQLPYEDSVGFVARQLAAGNVVAGIFWEDTLNHTGAYLGFIIGTTNNSEGDPTYALVKIDPITGEPRTIDVTEEDIQNAGALFIGAQAQ